MPFAFPSHQGLILPLVRWFPRRIDAVALSVGAAMPDIVEFALWPIRGELGHWMGHSLIGVLLAIPPGLALTKLTRRVTPRDWIARLEGQQAPGASNDTWRGALSVGIGALSHVVFDLVTHANCLLFWPWYEGADLFPAWWSRAWAGIPLFFYREPYPVAPHFLVWVALTTLGAWMFVRHVRRR